MEVPDIPALKDVQKDDDFSKTVEEVKTQANKTVAKAFTLFSKDLNRITAVAMAEGNKHNRIVSASEALRLIIKRDEREFPL